MKIIVITIYCLSLLFAIISSAMLMRRLKKWQDNLKRIDDFYVKRELEFRQVYSDALKEIYNLLDMHIKSYNEIENPQLKEQIEKLKNKQDNLYTYLVKLELCDIPVKEKEKTHTKRGSSF